MVAVYKSSILFKINEDDQNPASLSYFIYNTTLQKITWESIDFQYITVTEEGFLGYREVEDKRKNLIIKHSDNKEITIDEEKGITNYKNSFNSPSENKILTPPFHYLEGSEYFELVKSYLFQKFKILPKKAIDYLELQNAIIISYYIYHKPEIKG
jgi:hypothetical protein